MIELLLGVWAGAVGGIAYGFGHGYVHGLRKGWNTRKAFEERTQSDVELYRRDLVAESYARAGVKFPHGQPNHICDEDCPAR
jgi:hypothetical protein